MAINAESGAQAIRHWSVAKPGGMWQSLTHQLGISVWIITELWQKDWNGHHRRVVTFSSECCTLTLVSSLCHGNPEKFDSDTQVNVTPAILHMSGDT